MIKCVIWDLDNTVWEGILSENIEVKIKDDVVDYITSFYKKGIINSICSKNDYNIAKAKLISLNLWDYFIYPQINWNDKSQNVEKIIRNLHIREQNVLFIDDNMYELDEVKNRFNSINICNADNYVFLDKILHNIDGMLTVEVEKRNQMYKDEVIRIEEQEKLQLNKTDFLMQCNIKMKIRKANFVDLPRVRELIERSHQINSSGVHYDENEIEKMIEDEEYYDVYIANVIDRYGSYGRSGVLIARKNEIRYEILLIIVSCRLLGKGITQAFLATIVNNIMNDKYQTVCCLFKRNDFNRQMIMLYTMNGFLKVENSEQFERYEQHCGRKELSLPAWIDIDFREEKND